ncbi:MAG: glycosyltransferase family 2 protein [Desulfamplus sp.]|nr:glycosyltransferase family 2 protein [Desulfamplus sp.]
MSFETQSIFVVIATISGRELLLNRLLKSIKQHLRNCSYRTICVYQCRNEDLSQSKLIDFECIDYFVRLNAFGASMARNIGIELALKNCSKNDYLTFPDDDCQFHKDIEQSIYFLMNQNVPVFFGDVRDFNDQKRLGISVFHKTKLLLNFFAINCPSFFINAGVLHDTEIRFNEYFGPGSTIKGVEETEFFSQLYRKGLRSAIYIKSLKIIHPSQLHDTQKNIDYSYAQGFLLKKLFSQKSILYWIYAFFVLPRPIFGYCVNIIKFNKHKSLFYKNRIEQIFLGFLQCKF